MARTNEGAHAHCAASPKDLRTGALSFARPPLQKFAKGFDDEPCSVPTTHRLGLEGRGKLDLVMMTAREPFAWSDLFWYARHSLLAFFRLSITLVGA